MTSRSRAGTGVSHRAKVQIRVEYTKAVRSDSYLHFEAPPSLPGYDL